LFSVSRPRLSMLSLSFLKRSRSFSRQCRRHAMKTKWTIALGVGVLAVFAALYILQPSRSPLGQPALMEMNDGAVARLQAEFNRTTVKARVILLLSPT
jgi:hypothetical protein